MNPTPEQLEPFARGRSAHRPYPGAFAIYNATLADLDRQMGRLLDGLEKLGITENTVVIFSSDNGPEDIQISTASHSGVGSAGPFRGRKRSLYEGGVRVPLVVRWPGRIPAGRIDNTSVIAAVDLLPTVCRLAGVPTPSGHRCDGEDVSDIFFGRPRARTKPLLWEWRFRTMGHIWNRSPQLAIRDGSWKLLMNPDRSRTELYNIPEDPTELTNLALSHPAIVNRLAGKVLEWHRQLPAGLVETGAGQADYLWPGSPGRTGRSR